MYEYCTKTNVWSFRLNYMGYSVIVFRHGFTCDNMYKEGSGLTMGFSRLNGKYSHLSIWGICSVKIFCNNNYSSLLNIQDTQKNILSVKRGFPKQPKNEILSKNLPNEITCGGDIGKRFNSESPSVNKNTFTSINTTSVSTKINKLVYMKPDSVIGSDIDKDISSLISIEFTKCSDKLLESTYGCIKLSCLYNQRYVIIRPYTTKNTNENNYQISFYDDASTSGSVKQKEIQIMLVNSSQNILEYEKVLLYLFDYKHNTRVNLSTSVIDNFNISSVINILITKGMMQHIIKTLENFSGIKPNVQTGIYYMEDAPEIATLV